MSVICNKSDNSKIARKTEDGVLLSHTESNSINPTENVVEKDTPLGNNLSRRALKRLRRERLRNDAKQANNVIGPGIQPKCQIKRSVNVERETSVIEEKCLSETDYYFENGLRKVHPYYFEFTTNAKERWFGQRLVDVFSKEFQNITAETCKLAIATGALMVNGKLTSVDHVIRNGDFITNKIHRHELPVTGEPIEVLENNDDVLTVNKPSSIPIHPCGRYRHNSILYILAKQHGFKNLRGIYRLDRLTSGLLIFCKTEEKTREMMEHIKLRLVQKEYVCQVQGYFPSGLIECNQPIDILSHKLGVYRVSPNGKESKTTFERLSYDDKTSIVKCRPHTGRTHQIRVHLQYLGYPIVNDPLYNGPEWGPDCGKDGDFGKSDDEMIAAVTQRHNSARFLETTAELSTSNFDLEELQGQDDEAHISHCNGEVVTSVMPDSFNTKLLSDSNVTDLSNNASCANTDSKDEDMPLTKKPKLEIYSCEVECSSMASQTSDELCMTSHPISNSFISVKDPQCRECRLNYKDPKPAELVMHLHAYRYQGPGWDYSTPMPTWANLMSTTP